MLHPDFPIVEGRYQMTENWAITLPCQFNRRIEDGSLVFWRPGITVWLIAWGNDKGETKDERLKWLTEDIAPEAFEQETLQEPDLIRIAYRLTEEQENGSVNSLNSFAIGSAGHIQMSVYFDAESELPIARQLWLSLSETSA